jgi:hypothetical protein
MKINAVALADILANGVAILLILIVLSIASKQQDIEKELEQIDQIGSVMSREIASSIITNALPSSSPAVLHDYSHPQKPGVPRIILVKDGVILDTQGDGKVLNQKISREELLRDNNRFDDFLHTLSSAQSRLLRADVHHIRQYYLVLSIIKKQKKRITHWHFLGESGLNKVEGNEGVLSATKHSTVETLEIETQDLPETQTAPSLSEGVDFMVGTQTKPLTERLNPIKTDLPSFGLSEAGKAQEFRRRLAKSAGLENQNFAQNLVIDFADGAFGAKELNAKGKNGEAQSLSKQILKKLFSYLELIQQAHLNQEFVKISKQDFKRRQGAFETENYQTEINQIYQGISALKVSNIETKAHLAKLNVFSVPINTHIQQLDTYLQSHNKSDIKNEFSWLLYPLPSMYQGVRISLYQDSVVLFATEYAPTEKFNWLPIAVLSPSLEEIKIGFVYARYQKNKLIIDSSINQSYLNNKPIVQRYDIDSWQGNFRFLMLAIIFLFVFYLFWRKQ